MESSTRRTSISKLVKISEALAAFAARSEFIIASETTFSRTSGCEFVLIEETTAFTSFIGELIIISEQIPSTRTHAELGIFLGLARTFVSERKWILVGKIRFALGFCREEAAHLSLLFAFANGRTESTQTLAFVHIHIR